MNSIRDDFVDFIILVARSMFYWVPGGDPAVGHIIWMIHTLLGPIGIISFFMLPQLHLLKYLIFIIVLGVHVSQWIFNGCVLTKAEQKLCGHNNIPDIDKFLNLAQIEPSYNTRFAATLSLSTATTYILACALLVDMCS
jgi:hypothetical protein